MRIRGKSCRGRQFVERVRRTKLSGKEESYLGRKSLRKSLMKYADKIGGKERGKKA